MAATAAERSHNLESAVLTRNAWPLIGPGGDSSAGRRIADLYTPTPLLDPIQSNPSPLTNNAHTPQEMETHTAPAARRPRCQPRLRLLPAPLLLSLAAALLAAVLAPAHAQVVRDNQGGHITTTTTTTTITTTAVAASSASPGAASAGQALLRKGRLRRDRGAGGRLGVYDEELADAMVDFAGAWRTIGLI